jgi:UTP:GlnB (protein PII) uridylyltransferase
MHLAHRVYVLVRLHELRHHVRNIHSHHLVRFPSGLSNRETAPSDQQLMKHFLFILARVENLQHDVELMVVVLGGLGQLCSDIEFLVLIESQACCEREFENFRE